METRSNKGITLIALVITIIVLLILAGISLSLVIGDKGILGRAEKTVNKNEEVIAEEEIKLAISEKTIAYYETDKTTELSKFLKKELNSYETPRGATINCDSEGNISYNGIKMAIIDLNGKVTMLNQKTENPTKPVEKWTQKGTIVMKGEITLKVGTLVTGYEANGRGDGNWYILGAENGKLLLTMNSSITGIALKGQEDYTNGIAKLNALAESYTNVNFADGKARSIKIEDINRVTGYIDNVYNEGENRIDQTGNEVTYTLKNGKVNYIGTKYPKENVESQESIFTYWTGNEWETLKEGKSVTLKNNVYVYRPNQEEIGQEAYNLLFANTTDINHYWIASEYINLQGEWLAFGLRRVWGDEINGNAIVCSNGFLSDTMGQSYGVRPVVTLNSEVKVSADGQLSL